mmetsp:Transcript_9272/g.27896  ORF Transcript_9272/g.27896 Transcript_9272/m.27896 type:complete len:491 (-) Transcript_9272:179-1651(-)
MAYRRDMRTEPGVHTTPYAAEGDKENTSKNEGLVDKVKDKVENILHKDEHHGDTYRKEQITTGHRRRSSLSSSDEERQAGVGHSTGVPTATVASAHVVPGTGGAKAHAPVAPATVTTTAVPVDAMRKTSIHETRSSHSSSRSSSDVEETSKPSKAAVVKEKITKVRRSSSASSSSSSDNEHDTGLSKGEKLKMKAQEVLPGGHGHHDTHHSELHERKDNYAAEHHDPHNKSTGEKIKEKVHDVLPGGAGQQHHDSYEQRRGLNTSRQAYAPAVGAFAPTMEKPDLLRDTRGHDTVGVPATGAASTAAYTPNVERTHVDTTHGTHGSHGSHGMKQKVEEKLDADHYAMEHSKGHHSHGEKKGLLQKVKEKAENILHKNEHGHEHSTTSSSYHSPSYEASHGGFKSEMGMPHTPAVTNDFRAGDSHTHSSHHENEGLKDKMKNMLHKDKETEHSRVDTEHGAESVAVQRRFETGEERTLHPTEVKPAVPRRY